jgi:HK97 gp10 family phage protein
VEFRAELQGMAELDRKLAGLSASLQAKALRQAASAAMQPTVAEMRLAAPVGKKAHKTYKGRLVAPGFLKRSLRKRTKIKDGKVLVDVGVRAEAYYGVLFIERGTVKMRAHPWFVRTFEANRGKIESRFREELQKRIEKYSRR